MASLGSIFLAFCLYSTLLMCFYPALTATDDDRKVYIVYMGALPSRSDYSPMSHHQNILQEVVGINFVGDTLIRSYGKSFNGFVARLTEVEVKKLASVEGVVSVFPSRELKIQTTRSWDFMGFDDKFKHNLELESDTIIGVIDSGIWPESDSFTDKGFGPPPKKWKGACKGGSNFTCNNKLIGVRSYVNISSGSSPSARDMIGHGTHTASIAAGNKVKGIDFYGIAKGIARGGVPSARIAAYRVCVGDTCRNEDILAGFDDAIADGVDVITISLAENSAEPLEKNSIAIGAFHALHKGILTVNSAGNFGPFLGTVTNVAPWLLTVAASSTDRKIVTKVVLGNDRTLLGRSINTFQLNGTKFPLAFGKTASTKCSETAAMRCDIGCLDRNLIRGKIVLCDQLFNVVNPEDFPGAVGVILNAIVDNAAIYSIPVSILDVDDFQLLLSYINSTKNPEGTILKSETIKDTEAPQVALFSSRGPNTIISDSLKPDITAPGVNILAAYSPINTVALDFYDKRRVKYNFLSGTSMSCPHVASVAAYVKSVHLDWSPSMIKSAIMTTAWAMNASSNEGAEFAYGSGHVNPTKASDPGLVYEATKDDYIRMLCALNYTTSQLRAITGDIGTCPRGSNKKMAIRNLNSPSMAAQVSSSSKPLNIIFSRLVTNVGTPNSTYKAQVTAGPKLSIKVVPNTLSFESLGEKKAFTVTISNNGPISQDFGLIESTSLIWSDGSHIVRSPIVVYS